ncbi:hypothetical protein AC578_1817 [Pseudocercospora eumusae]|uniref:Uncharacterized protein n=1 Tax=Pseudocercospora eumusae TaxID=321146 RepID=A0A139HKC2_9PEZI|nr:hypothetical protein AC578_1817 [Pseudocercospora eumusae]
MAKQELNFGIVGAGIGGVMAATAAKTGAKVTLLEAADQLGEIGAWIYTNDAKRGTTAYRILR